MHNRYACLASCVRYDCGLSMSTLQRTADFAQMAGDTLTQAQGPGDVQDAMKNLWQLAEAMRQLGAKDQYLAHIVRLFESCAPSLHWRCENLEQHSQWAAGIYRFWATALSTRHMLMAWADMDTKDEGNIKPANLLASKDVEPQDSNSVVLGRVTEIGNDTANYLTSLGIVGFPQWKDTEYQSRVLGSGRRITQMPGLPVKGRRLVRSTYHSHPIMGFLAWRKESVAMPKYNDTRPHTIGGQTLHIRRVWDHQITIDRLGVDEDDRAKPQILYRETMLQIVFDLINICIAQGAPLQLPEEKK